MRSLLASLAAVAALVLPAPSAPPTVRYQPPVPAPVVDPFRPPSSPFGPGNRGVDYATVPGTVVGAAAPGEVVFAGPVGGSLHVVVLHGDGLRTSYSFLVAVSVRRGQRVEAGQEVGRAGPSLHFGVRRGDAYLDPMTLFGTAGAPVHLVPDPPPEPTPEAGRHRGTPAGEPARGPAMVDGDALRWARGGARPAPVP